MPFTQMHGITKLLLIIYLADAASAAAGDAVKKEVWQPLCSVAEALAAAAPQRAAKLKTSITAADLWLKDKLKIMVYFARQQAATAATLKPMLAAIPDLPAITAGEIQTAVDKALNAQAAGSYLQGRLAEFAEIAAGAYATGATHGCLQANGGTTAVQGRSALGNCGVETDFAKAAKTTAAVDDPLSLFDTLTETSGEATMGGTVQNCALTQHTGTSLVGAQTLAAPVAYAAGYLSTPTRATTMTNIDKPAKAGKKFTSADTYATVGNLLIAAAENKIAAGKEHTKFTIKDLQKSAAAKEAAHHQLLKKTKKYEPNTDAGPASEKLEEIYKDNDKETDLKVWKDIKATQIPKKEFSDEDSGETSLSDIQTVEQLLKLLSNSIIAKNNEIIKLKADVEANKNNKQSSNSEEVCNKITDTDPKTCNATEHCHFVESNEKGKKCTLKKEIKEKLENEIQEKGGKDDKTTNTTGSNSFVINKAPLWLAVLLF
uniref:Variant surface glycoprotein n=1 Tax=Trypanosoma brucei TaxID=5691 RepID=A0A1V0G0C5_9TRYP|nr:variant surface glycoprotein [Trypanosoma brucei]